MTVYDAPYYLLSAEPIGLSLAGAHRAPVAYGPRLSAGVTPAPITARLFRPTDLINPVLTFTAGMSRQWQDKLNDLGAGQMELLNDDAQLASIQDGDLIRFELHGDAAMTWEIAERDRIAIDPGEQGRQTTRLSGPSHLAILSRSLVYPQRTPIISPQVASRAIAVGAPIEEDRIFGWMSPEYDDSSWIAPTAQGDMAAAATNMTSFGWAPDFPAQSAQYLWAASAVPFLWAPGGRCWFRASFTTTEPMIHMYVAGDNSIRLYLDGELIIDFRLAVHTSADIMSEKLPVAAGDHTIAVEMENYGGEQVRPPGGFNPAGLAVAIYELDSNGLFTTYREYPLLKTDTANWKILPYPPSPPGMTPGHALKHVIDEVNQRRGTPAIEMAFDEYVDSAGNPWATVAEYGTKVGSDIMTFLREMSATYVDFWMEPAAFRLHVWNKDQRGSTRNITLEAPTDATDPTSGNLAGLSQRRVA